VNEPHPVNGAFPGLNLATDPLELGFAGAIDMSNVEPDRPGTPLRKRRGWARLTTTLGTNLYTGLGENTTHIVAGAGTRVEAINKSTGAVTSSTTLSAPTFPFRFQRYGSAVYFTNGVDQVQKCSGSTFTAPAGLAAITARPLIAMQPVDNRLVTTLDTTLYFSAPNDPEDFSGADSVTVDGNIITEICAWDNSLYVFIADRFYVFYGNSTDSTGGTVFNYRTVNTGIGVPGNPERVRAVATPEGVYFAGPDGIYLTSGGPPVKVTQDLGPLFDNDGTVPSYYTGDEDSVSAMAYAGGVLFCLYDTDRVLAYHLESRQWFQWSSDAVDLLAGEDDRLYFPQGSVKHIGYFHPELTTDNGTAIAWYYQSGFDDLGQPVEKVVRDLELWGTGSVTLQIATDHDAVDTGSALTLGVTTSDTARQRTARRGTFFSYRLSGSGSGTVNRLVFHPRDARAR
jgi:hypothetical protein